MRTLAKQTAAMGGVALVFLGLYCFPFEQQLMLSSIVIIVLFPIQVLLWKIGFGRKAKDFFLCFSVVILDFILKHYWKHGDMAFYVTAIVIAAIVRYRVFIGLNAAAMVIEVLRESFYGYEKPYDILIRHALFFVAGSLTHAIVRDEVKEKEKFRRRLEDLKYGIHQVERQPSAALSSSDQTSRSMDAAISLDDSLKNTLQLIYSIFKPNAVLLWQYLPKRKQLRLRKYAGHVQNLRENLMLSLGEGPVGWAALNKKVFLQQGKPEGIRTHFYKKKFIVRSLLAVPIVDGDRVEGVISLDSEHPTHFAEDVEKSIAAFAHQIAEMITMARRAKEREERVHEFQAFYNASKELSSIINFEEIISKLHLLCSDLVTSDFTVIAVLENESTYTLYVWNGAEENPERIEGIENSGTWVSWFLQNREEPLIVSNAQLEIQQMPLLYPNESVPEFSTLMAVPLRHQMKCIGALLTGHSQADAYSSEQSRILSILCNQAAVSLENASIINKMEELAITDGLTGLYNHRYFQESFDKELERSQRQNQPLTLLLLDIDHFKGFNDSFGHPAGDFVLRNLAALMKANGRKVDILARYGGEEFAALLPGIDLKNGRKTAERWRKAIQRAAFKWEGKSFAVTVSIGVVTFPDDGGSKAELIERADRGLYDAKANGRNQVRHWRDEEEKKSRLFG